MASVKVRTCTHVSVTVVFVHSTKALPVLWLTQDGDKQSRKYTVTSLQAWQTQIWVWNAAKWGSAEQWWCPTLQVFRLHTKCRELEDTFLEDLCLTLFFAAGKGLVRTSRCGQEWEEDNRRWAENNKNILHTCVEFSNNKSNW